MDRSPPMDDAARTGRTFFAAVAKSFPVAAASDEFYFFPQALSRRSDWSRWDDFSDETVGTFTDRCRSWEKDLSAAAGVDARCLAGTVRTLREQLDIIVPHRRQPTFHLTVAAAGLVEALESADDNAWAGRSSGLGTFLHRAASLLREVPRPFLAAGIAMAGDLAAWLDGLAGGEAAAEAVRIFGEHLGRLQGTPSFLLPADQYERLLRDHYGIGAGAGGSLAVIEEEIGEMEELLAREAGRLVGGDWRRAAGQVPGAELPPEGSVGLYRREAREMKRHCVSAGLHPEAADLEAPLRVEAVPSFLEAVRASDAYQALPGSPPRGGIFFVRERKGGRGGRSIEYRMTCAHETWPGHHLLDVCRWQGRHALRRPLELPLYYEGWACLAEELMARTGYLDGPWDRFLLARRRFRRAVRGKVDIGLQTGTLGAGEASALLVDAGFDPAEAAAAVPKFALRPGYQVCYTLGLRRFLALLNNGPCGDPHLLARQVLEAGEIGFDELEKELVGEGA